MLERQIQHHEQHKDASRKRQRSVDAESENSLPELRLEIDESRYNQVLTV